MQLLELTIDDTSPLIVYSPFRDTLSTPDLSNGWNPYYNTSGFASPIGRVGIGESYHITSMDGASLSVKWNGNGIRLLGNTTSCSFALTLDGADLEPDATSLSNTLVDIPDLQYGVHTLTLTTRISQNQAPRNSSLFVFDGALIRTIAHGVSSDFTFRQQPLDSRNVSYNGRWAFGPSPTGQQFYISNTTGDRASTTFNGTAFILQGMTTPELGNYSVTLDGVITSLSAQSSFTVPNTTLFFATGLNDSFIHSVEVTNNGGKLSLLDGGFWTVAAFSGLVPPPPDSLANSKSPDASFSGGTVAAFALAGVLFAIIATIVLFLIWRKRRRIRNDHKPRTWDDKKYVVPNSRPGYGSSFRNSWRFNRQNRASSDFASYGAKGDTITLESAHLEGTRSLRSGRLNEFSTWHREEDSEVAVEGNVQDISLPILFKHSDESEFAPESRHPYSVYDPTSNRDRSTEMKNLKSSTSSTHIDIDRTSVALANLKNKGKARQITGAGSTMEEDSFFETSSRLSFSPNDLLRGLHLKMSGGKKNFSRIKSPQGSVSLSLNPSTSPVPQFRDSGVSSFHAASNPSARGRESQQQSPSSTSPTETLPSFPRSVSDSNSNTIIPHRRQNSRGYLLDDQTELGEDLGSGGRSSPPPFHAYRNPRNNLRNILPSSLSLRQVVRSLSPRISEMRIEGDHNNNNNPHTDHGFYPETLAEQQSILEEDRLLTVMAPSTPSGRDSMSTVQFTRNGSPSVVARGLPFSPSPEPSETPSDNQVQSDTIGLSTHAELDRTRLSPTLPSLKRTSPFNIWFDWQSERQSKRASESSKLRVPGQFDSREDSVQGTSRNRFRLTPLTMTHSPSIDSSSAPSRESTSFLDFTNSSEDSSTRTNSFSTQFGSRIFGDSASSIRRGGRMAELKSRWSDTTSSTMRRDSSREQQQSSSAADKSSRRRTYHTSTIPPPSIYVTSSSPSSEIQLPTKNPAQRESDSTQFSTENPVHVHPSSILDHELESRRDSLRSQRAPLDTLVVDRTQSTTTTSGSDESSSGTSSRWISSESSSQFHTRLLAASRYPPLPEGTDEASTSSVYLPNPSS